VLFERGREALAEGRFAQARQLLDQSLALAPNKAVAFGAALARERVGSFVAAEELLLALDGGDFGALDEVQRQRVAESLVSVRSQIATIELHAPPGVESVTVTVDGVQTPLGVVRVDPGQRRITARAPGRGRWTTSIALPPGTHRRVELELEPEAELATLRARAGAEQALRVEDGEGNEVSRGRGSLALDLAPGSYVVQALDEGGDVAATEQLLLAPGEARELSLDTGSSSRRRRRWIGALAGVLAVGAGLTLGLVLRNQRQDDIPLGSFYDSSIATLSAW